MEVAVDLSYERLLKRRVDDDDDDDDDEVAQYVIYNVPEESVAFIFKLKVGQGVEQENKERQRRKRYPLNRLFLTSFPLVLHVFFQHQVPSLSLYPNRSPSLLYN